MFSFKFSKKMSRNPKIFLIVQGNFGKYIEVERRNYVFKACKWEIPDYFVTIGKLRSGLK